MAMTLRKRAPAPRPQESPDSSPIRKRPKPVSRRPVARRRTRWSSRDSDFDDADSFSERDDEEEEEEEEEEEVEDEVPEYEKIREQRMRENKEKMEKLGIFSLSHNFKPQVLPRRAYKKKKPSVTRSFAAAYQSARKSSRLKEVGRVTYFKDEGTLESMGISVPEEWAPEVYTEEHEKLLGDCEKPWELYVDGYGEDGERLYSQLTGKMCHQCRQKTVGQISVCRKCKSPQGQICGDCLYMRYGENVVEANENINWSCPCCRDICNCSRCRRAKGWKPTICVYQKVIEQGHKSIAHYLIHSQSVKNKPKGTTGLTDSNAEPELTSQSGPQMIYSDSSESSSDDEPDGYNSDSSEEAEKNSSQVEKNQEEPIVVDVEEDCETDAMGNKEEVMVDELKDA